MAMEVTSEKSHCYRCGTSYSRYKGYFPVSYAVLHKGVGYIPVCKTCIDDMYNTYLAQCNDQKSAVRQVCRKLDLYWSEKVYELVSRKTTIKTIMTQYIAKINSVSYAGKSYDDTLSDEGTLWSFMYDDTTEEKQQNDINKTEKSFQAQNNNQQDPPEIPDEVLAFWGEGYTPEMYASLEQRRSYWMSKFPKDYEPDIGAEAIIRQICSLELDINRDRAAGRAVDKSVNALNTLLGSASLKPAQKKNDADASIYNTPMGVWIDRFEFKRPIPEDTTDGEKNYLKKYILSWFSGHLSKMMGVKNANSKLYEEEIAKYRVARPEFDDDSDDDMMYEILSDSEYDADNLRFAGGDNPNDKS